MLVPLGSHCGPVTGPSWPDLETNPEPCRRRQRCRHRPAVEGFPGPLLVGPPHSGGGSLAQCQRVSLSKCLKQEPKQCGPAGRQGTHQKPCISDVAWGRGDGFGEPSVGLVCPWVLERAPTPSGSRADATFWQPEGPPQVSPGCKRGCACLVRPALLPDSCRLGFTILVATVGPEVGDSAPLSLGVLRGKVGAARGHPPEQEERTREVADRKLPARG